MTDRIRVLHLALDLDCGGMERVVADIVRCADRDRFDCRVLVFHHPGRLGEPLEAAGQLERAEQLRRYSMLWPGPLVRQIQRIAPDVVHTHSGVWYKGALAARHAGVARVFHTEHGRWYPDPWQHRMLDRLAARWTHRVIAVSAALADQLARTIVGDVRRIRVVVNGVDTDRFQPRPDDGAIRRQLGIPAAAPIIGSVGRLDAVKGYDLMLEAFVALRVAWSAGTPPVLLIAGDGPEGPRLARLVERLRLKGVAHVLGWRDDVRELHRAFTLFTMSSHSEGTSVSLLEAMSAGLCPVVTDAGGNGAVLGTELRHRLVPPGRADALAAAWEAALADPAGRARDGETARRRVIRRFGIEAMVRRYERLYAGEDQAVDQMIALPAVADRAAPAGRAGLR